MSLHTQQKKRVYHAYKSCDLFMTQVICEKKAQVNKQTINPFYSDIKSTREPSCMQASDCWLH